MEPLIPTLAKVVREAREEAGLSREQVAVAAARSADSVRYFERGEHSALIDRMVEAYAEALGIKPEELWARAVRRADQESDRQRPSLDQAEAEAERFAARHEPSGPRRRRSGAPKAKQDPRPPGG